MTEQMYRDLAKHDNLEDLYRRYHEIDQEVEKAKGRRVFLVFAGTFLLNLIVIACIIRPSNLSSWLICLLVGVLAAAFHFWLSFGVYSWLFTRNLEDNERRTHITMRIKYAEEYQSDNEQKAGN